MRWDPEAQAAAKEALKELGFGIEKKQVPEAEGIVDFVARKGSDRYAVEVKAQVPFRRDPFRGAIADAILRLGHYSRKSSYKPLLCLWMDKASPNAVAELQDYVKRYAHQLNWLLLDSSGWRKWHIENQGGEQQNAWHSLDLSWRPSKRISNPFAPKHQWMLKVLLLPGMEPRYWGGPQVRPSSLSELARIAGVSQAHAFNCVSALEEHGYLVRDGREFHFPRLRPLLEDWASAFRLKIGKVLQAKSIYPENAPGASIERLVQRIAREAALEDPGRDSRKVALGSHYACQALGLGFANVSWLRVYVSHGARQAIERLRMAPADLDDAICEFVEPYAKDSALGGRVRAHGLWLCDVLQCYLDVRSSPARGEEQAEHLFERVLAPHFRKLQWL